MKAKIFLIVLFTILACASSFSETQNWQHVILLDVHGLWGGKDIWISSDAKAFCRLVRPPTDKEAGLQEFRYSFELSEAQMSELSDCLNKHNLSEIKTSNRPGSPDEAAPAVYVKTSEKAFAVSKWANDKNENYDAIYEVLQKICSDGKKNEPFKKGSLEIEWNPEGFPENQTVRDMAESALHNK